MGAHRAWVWVRRRQHAKSIMGKDNANRCSECWMANGQCICSAIPQLADSPGDAKLARVFLYTHHDEMHRRLSTNTGKLLQLVLGHQRVKRVVLAQHAQELSMVRELGEAMRRQKSLFPLSRCFVLFPSQCSSTLGEVLLPGRQPSQLTSSTKMNQRSLRKGLTVVLLDGTWSDVKALNKRLDVLLSIYLRDFADRPEADAAYFPFRSCAQRECLMLAQSPAESGTQLDHRNHRDSKATAPSTDSRVSLDGQELEAATASPLEGGLGDGTKLENGNLDNGWRRVLPRVRLSRGAAQVAKAAVPSLRKHDPGQGGDNSDGRGDARCTLDDSGGGAAAEPAPATSSAFATKERVGTAGAFAILLSELASLARLDSEALVEQYPAASVLMTAGAHREAAQASTTGDGQSQGYTSSGALSSARAREERDTTLEGLAPPECTQEGSSSEWRALGAAVLTALDIQAEAFNRQMHGVK